MLVKLADFGLSELQEDILRVICAESSDKEWTTYRIWSALMLPAKFPSSAAVGRMNKVRANLVSLRRKGFVLSKSRYHGGLTWWRAGPLSDLWRDERDG